MAQKHSGVIEGNPYDLSRMKLAWWQWGLVGLGGILVLVGVLIAGRSMAQETTVEIIQASPLVESTSTSTVKEIVVDISGRVERPGVYKLAEGSRMVDALAAAGGLAAKADRYWVAKNLNLAGKLVDGAKIYVPAVGEAGAVTVNSNPSTSLGAGSNQAGVININTATSGELDTLPGVGPATANKIISNRPYQSIEELVTKKAVSQKVFDGLKEKVAL